MISESKPTIEEVRSYNESVVRDIQQERAKNAKVLHDLFLNISISHEENARKVQ